MRHYVTPFVSLNELDISFRTQGTGGAFLANCDSSIDCPDQNTDSRLGVTDCGGGVIEVIAFLEGSELSSADFFSVCQIGGISGLDFSNENCTLTESNFSCQNGFVYDFICDLTDSCPPPDATVVLTCEGYQTEGNCSVELN